jgi:hypothetical protein
VRPLAKRLKIMHFISLLLASIERAAIHISAHSSSQYFSGTKFCEMDKFPVVFTVILPQFSFHMI